VPRRSKHPLLTSYTRHEPNFMIMSAELFAVKVRLPSTVKMYHWYEKYGSMKVCNYKLDHCNSHRTCETLTSNETTNPCNLNLSVSVYPDSKTDLM
jgi:hypothetical protein